MHSNLTMGDIPLLAVGVKVHPDERAVLFSLCTTEMKCLRLNANAHSQTVQSIRKYSVAVQAFNTLFWEHINDSMIQHTMTFHAEEMVRISNIIYFLSFKFKIE